MLLAQPAACIKPQPGLTRARIIARLRANEFYKCKPGTKRARSQYNDNNREAKMTETPKYSVSKKQNEIEIRQYPGYIQAEVTVEEKNYKSRATRKP